MLENLRIAAIYVDIILLAAHLQHILEVLNLERKRVVAENIFEEVVLECVELVEFGYTLVGSIPFR